MDKIVAKGRSNERGAGAQRWGDRNQGCLNGISYLHGDGPRAGLFIDAAGRFMEDYRVPCLGAFSHLPGLFAKKMRPDEAGPERWLSLASLSIAPFAEILPTNRGAGIMSETTVRKDRTVTFPLSSNGI